jgi:hypothetical protein
MNSILRLAHDSGKETIMDLYGIAQEGTAKANVGAGLFGAGLVFRVKPAQ